MDHASTEAAMRTGPPREFDLDRTLDSAVQVFWQQGYEGTAIADPTEALGINRPSLYAAFGNKESLFLRVLERYSEQRAAYVLELRRSRPPDPSSD
jgi:AcrR family transcriptional regulator